VDTVYLPGVYDTPLAADRLARQDSIDAVAVLGPAITGNTDHDQVIAHSTARKLSDISLNRDTPITFGVSGPDMSTAEAWDRIEYCANAVDAALEIADELPDRTEN
jgi:6,7-dimethyl-8-ribityllumazine synthase